MKRWLELGEDEILVCEGDEDLDRLVLAPGGATVAVRLEQVKKYQRCTRTLSARCSRTSS